MWKFSDVLTISCSKFYIEQKILNVIDMKALYTHEGFVLQQYYNILSDRCDISSKPQVEKYKHMRKLYNNDM